MELLWNGDWSFALLPLESTYEEMCAAEKRPVILPHDWLIEDTRDLYRNGDGWYVKTLNFGAEYGDRALYLDFDGVYMDADVLVNGQVVCTHRYGYTSFRVALTGLLRAGENEIAVHIRHQSPNSRWYSGAGIYRDVHLAVLPRRHMVPDGFQVHTTRSAGRWTLEVQAELSSPGEGPEMILRDAQGNALARGQMEAAGTEAYLCLHPEGVQPWSPDDPVLYNLTLTLGEQEETISVGFRETVFDPQRGFFLNGQPMKLRGVCLHHDLGALGAAFHEKAAERQLRVMKGMGVNAIRTAHNPPARLLLDLCDRLGVLVMDELYDMWERPKTPCDNARFFQDTWQQDVAAWVRRDRCHPSVILWSIGNEIHDMFASIRGRMWTRLLTDEVRRHDNRHAQVTFGSNYMPWEGAQGCADVVKIPGYNYAEKYYAGHHAAHPDWVIFGSETGSLLYSRGIYHFPMERMILSEEDMQCSALLNSNTSWGAQDLRKMLVEDQQTPYSMGQFVWSGIDYIGEPTPYHTRSCYFGQADTACFPKDSYYFYQAMWTDAPMVHIGIYWDWNEGQLIDVPVMTNAHHVELLLNGESLGVKRVDRVQTEESLPVWRVPYQRGVLQARAYDAQGRLLCSAERSSFGEACALALTADRTELRDGCGDMAFLTVTVLDAAGNPVENACDRVHVQVEGAAVLLGLDNGDSADRDGYQVTSRRLFSGKLLAMVGARGTGEARVKVNGKGLKLAEVTLRVVPCEARERRVFPDLCKEDETEEETFIRRIDLRALGSTRLTPEHPQVEFAVSVLPADAMQQELTFRVTNGEGVDMPCAAVTQEGDRVRVTALGDGNMYLRAAAANGYPHSRVLSVLEVSAAGFGPVGVDPYRFVAGALSDIRIGEITSGNDRGVAFARDGFSVAGFSHVDFGRAGSDELVLPVFALDGNLYEIGLWDGIPGQGGRQITTLRYQKPSIWNVYQAETYHLPEVLRGVHDVCFSLDRKVHLQGFTFTRCSRALRRCEALEADQIYGDTFRRGEDGVYGIGNNVTLVFEEMEFSRDGMARLHLEGATSLQENAVTLRIVSDQGEERVSTCLFAGGPRKKQTFEVAVPRGMCTVSFVFLPGSSFDFFGFRFEED